MKNMRNDVKQLIQCTFQIQNRITKKNKIKIDLKFLFRSNPSNFFEL